MRTVVKIEDGAAATCWAMCCNVEGLRLEGRALQLVAVLGRLSMYGATIVVMAALPMPRLCDSIALPIFRHRGTHAGAQNKMGYE